MITDWSKIHSKDMPITSENWEGWGPSAGTWTNRSQKSKGKSSLNFGKALSSSKQRVVSWAPGSSNSCNSLDCLHFSKIMWRSNKEREWSLKECLTLGERELWKKASSGWSPIGSTLKPKEQPLSQHSRNGRDSIWSRNSWSWPRWPSIGDRPKAMGLLKIAMMFPGSKPASSL